MNGKELPCTSLLSLCALLLNYSIRMSMGKNIDNGHRARDWRNVLKSRNNECFISTRETESKK